MSEIIATKSLSKSFDEGCGKQLEVLCDIDAVFSKRSTISIVGSSGCGKSTLLHLLGGLDHPTSGGVFFEGKDLTGFSQDQLAIWRNKKIGFVFQSHHLLPDFTAIENVMMPGIIFGESKKIRRQRGKDLLAEVGLSDRLEHKPGELSGGEQQRVAIARAIFNKPALILADEPTGNLDIETGHIVGELLKKLCIDSDSTMVLVTHNPQLASEMDFQFELSNGTLLQLHPD